MNDKIQEIKRLIGFNQFLSPTFNDKEIIKITCRSLFEGHGRASETWEEDWLVELPLIQAYWKGTNGYNKCNDGVYLKRNGSDLNIVLDNIIEQLKNAPIEVINI